jgi:hypothetical protein
VPVDYAEPDLAFGTSQRPVNASFADPQPFGDGEASQAVGVHRHDPVALVHRGRIAASVFPRLLGLFDADPLAFQHVGPLEFGEGTEHRQHQLAGGAVGVDAFTLVEVEDHKVDALVFQGFHDRQQPPDAAGQTISKASRPTAEACSRMISSQPAAAGTTWSRLRYFRNSCWNDLVAHDLDGARKERDAAKEELTRVSAELFAALEQERDKAIGLAHDLSAVKDFDMLKAQDERRTARIERATPKEHAPPQVHVCRKSTCVYAGEPSTGPSIGVAGNS